MSATEIEKNISNTEIGNPTGTVRGQMFGIPQCVDGRHTLFQRIRCTTGLLRSLSGCHICRTSPDYGLPECVSKTKEDEIIVT